jgi:arylsulfatase A-like enzyme
MAGMAGCRQAPADSAPATAKPAGRPNVLLVTIDTLRADHLGAYGYATASTSTLDALAHRGVRFETAVAHVPLTGPVARVDPDRPHPARPRLSQQWRIRITAFRENGCGGVSPGGLPDCGIRVGVPARPRFGFDRGFDVYDDHLPRGNDPRRQAYVERFGDATTDVALKWLSSAAAGATATPQPWFLWVHYYDPHAPYEPPGDLADRFRAAPYDGEIAFVDRQIARVLEAIDKSGAAIAPSSWSPRTTVKASASTAR